MKNPFIKEYECKGCGYKWPQDRKKCMGEEAHPGNVWPFCHVCHAKLTSQEKDKIWDDVEK